MSARAACTSNAHTTCTHVRASTQARLHVGWSSIENKCFKGTGELTRATPDHRCTSQTLAALRRRLLFGPRAFHLLLLPHGGGAS